MVVRPNNPLTHVRLAEALCHLAKSTPGIAAFLAAGAVTPNSVASMTYFGSSSSMNFKAEPALARLGAKCT